MHEREGAKQGMRYIYKLVDLERLGLGAEALPELLTAAERMGFAGLKYDDKEDLDRLSFVVRVSGGRHEFIATLPAAGG